MNQTHHHQDSVDNNTVRYIFSVWVDVVVEADGQPRYSMDEMKAYLLAALRKIDGDVDIAWKGEQP